MRANLATLVEDFRAHGAETAVVAHRGNRSYRTSYGELAELAGRFAAELERRGVGPGERVVLWGANSAEWIGVFFGCMLRAVIAVPLDAAGSAEFAARVIRDTGPRLVVGDGELLAALASSQFSVLSSQLSAAMELRGIGERLPREPLWEVSAAVNAETPFQIVFTSGTTSEPRGIVHTHRNILVTLGPIESEIKKYIRYERVFHPLRFLHSLPLSHVFGQFMGLWCPALLAAEVHFSDQLDPARVTALIRRERVSVLIAVPRVLALLKAYLVGRFPESSLPSSQLSVLSSQFSVVGSQLEDKSGPTSSQLSVVGSQLSVDDQPGGVTGKRRTENSQLRTGGVGAVLKKWWRFRRVHRALGWKFWAVISGGATLPAELEAFWGRLGYALIQGYGMTETSALVTLNHPFHIKQGTIGKPMPGREVKLTDEGEILVRGEMVSGATWQHGAMQRREGEWLATGDLAERSESGELRFLGRKGDVIVTSAGLNIYPADLEAALGAEPGIRAAAVVACAGGAGPEPVAVVLTALAQGELERAVGAANRRLAEFQQIRRVLKWPEMEFPYTSTGKLVRRQVAAWACATLEGRRAAAGAAPADTLLAMIAEVTGEPAPETEDADRLRLSEDLHLDSLGRVQLGSALGQRFALDMDDDALAGAETVGDVRRLVEGAEARQQPGQAGAARVAGAASAREPGGSVEGPARGGVDAWKGPGSGAAVGAPAEWLPPPDEHIYPYWPWSRPVQLLRAAFIELIAQPLTWLLAAPRVRYSDPSQMEHWEHEPVLIICNHITTYDGPLALYALPPRLRRHVAIAMSGEMLLDFRRMRNQGNFALNLLAPAAYWLLTALYNVFPLPRGRGFRRSFEHAGEALDRGYSVMIFPEGTRSLIGRMNAFRPGIGLLAEQSRAAILPVALVGLYEYTEAGGEGRRRRRWFHAGNLEVRVGRLVPAATDATDPAAMTAELERAVHALLEGSA